MAALWLTALPGVAFFLLPQKRLPSGPRAGAVKG
jgi:ABC-type maltose transport system permease subunit